MALRILFIENQAYDMEVYAEPLRQSYSLTVAHSVLQARDFVADNRLQGYDLILLDVMMPPEHLFSLAESENGILTGIRFFEIYLKGKPQSKPIAVMILTAATGHVMNRIKDCQKSNPQIISVHQKSNTNPLDLMRKVDDWAKLHCSNGTKGI